MPKSRDRGGRWCVIPDRDVSQGRVVPHPPKSMPQIWPSAYILAPLASPTPGCPSSWILSRDLGQHFCECGPRSRPRGACEHGDSQALPQTEHHLVFAQRSPSSEASEDPTHSGKCQPPPGLSVPFTMPSYFVCLPPRGVPEDRASLCLLLESRALKQKEIWSPGRQAALSGDISGCSDLREKGAPGIEPGEAGDAGQHLTTHGTATTTKSRPAP